MRAQPYVLRLRAPCSRGATGITNPARWVCPSAKTGHCRIQFGPPRGQHRPVPVPRKKNIAKTILPSAGNSLTKRLNTERPHGKTQRKAKTKAGDNEQTPIRAVLGTAWEVGADEGSGAFERTLSSLAPPKERPEKSQGPIDVFHRVLHLCNGLQARAPATAGIAGRRNSPRRPTASPRS